MDRAKIVIQKFFDGKGFKNVDVDIVQHDDLSKEGEVIVDINIDKNEKTKIHRIYFEGNEALSARDLKKAMKKTNEKFSLPNDWKTSILEAFSTKSSLLKNTRMIRIILSLSITNTVIVMQCCYRTVLSTLMKRKSTST